VRALVCVVLLLPIATSCSDTPGGNDDDGALVVTFEQNASTGDAGGALRTA
jgi:predicted outer membrane repeat protein